LPPTRKYGKKVNGIKHGIVTGYRYHKCRCKDCVDAQYAAHQAWIDSNYEQSLDYARRKHTKAYHILRATVIATLGGECLNCGIDDARVLEIDHINGDGKADRKKHGRADTMFRNIIENGHRDKYQLLCANCHRLKTHHGLVVIRR